MEVVEEVIDIVEPSIRLRFAKMIVAGTAGFIATELAKKGFDRFVEYRQNKSN